MTWIMVREILKLVVYIIIGVIIGYNRGYYKAQEDAPEEPLINLDVRNVGAGTTIEFKERANHV